jgi:aminoglycoside phosphotransferase (APT) family kinase protein
MRRRAFATSGLECGPTPSTAFLVDHDLVKTFEAGWSMLYRNVSLFVADQLVSTLADLHCVDADSHRDLRALRLELEKQRDAGTPWLARDAADALAMLDMTAWISVLGLLDECPILPAALTAVLEHRTTPVSPTAFEFISTTDQIGDIRLFMRTLPSLLSH